MLDSQTFQQELRAARKIRIRAQAAGRYLDGLVRSLHRNRCPWQYGAFGQALPAPSFFILSR